MSMTDQVPAQTRRATELLPSNPRFVGMVDLQTALGRVDEFKEGFTDSLHQGGPPRLREFLDITGLDPEADLNTVYGSVGNDGNSFTAVLFADLSPDQVDRYLEEGPEDAGQRTEYRGVPVYHLPLGAAMSGKMEEDAEDGDEESDVSSDTLALAFVDNGTIAVSPSVARTRAVVDRHQDGERRLRDDDAYMALVKRMGRDRTAWIAGRNVLQTAFGDSTAAEPSVASDDTSTDESPSVAQAGIQRALVQWSNRVLGLNEVPSGMSALEEKTDGRIGQLKQKVREQALAVTLTDAALEGDVYLTMADNASAGNVVEMAEGLLAILRLSEGKLSDRQKDLLEEANVERDGALVRVRFSVARELIGPDANDTATAARQLDSVRWADSSIRPANEATRRLTGILSALPR